MIDLYAGHVVTIRTISKLVSRVLAWVNLNGPARFHELTDAMGEDAGDVDAAAREAGVLHWIDDGIRGRFDVCRPCAGEETRA